jgi:DNA-binding CsgD family transcriptional regulator
LLNRFATRSSERVARAGVHALTTREHEIAGLLADGMSNKLIARRLQVALPTVKNHVHSILEKWDVRSRGEAAARYRQMTPETIKPSGGTLVELRAVHAAQADTTTARNAALWHGMPPHFGRRAA